MRNRPFSEEEIVLNHLVLHFSDYLRSPGLLTGKMGAVIAIAHFADKRRSDASDSIADTMMRDVIHSLPKLRDLTFSSGLCGIMWGVEYLVQNDLMPGPAEDICKEGDRIIEQANPQEIQDLSLETGVRGLWECVWARIQGNMKYGLPLPFSKFYLEKLKNILLTCQDIFPEDSLQRLESALRGELIEHKLEILPLIELEDPLKFENLSLQSGYAGKLLKLTLN